MKKSFGGLLTAILSILGITLFCSLLTSPISYGLPLKCPEGSRVIGIECFDAAYNNTTPWYRKDFGASVASFPFWLAGFSALAIWAAVTSRFSSPPKNTKEDTTKIDSDILNRPQPVPPPKTVSVKSKQWLPEACPHCGGAITTQNVEWVSNFEAKCPYCGGVLKE